MVASGAGEATPAVRAGTGLAVRSGTVARATANRRTNVTRGFDDTLRAVYVFRDDDSDDARGHETATHEALARRLAALVGLPFDGRLSRGETCAGGKYIVPDRTLGAAEARRLGITREADLFGGVVPFPFVSTKVITHVLARADGVRPDGWSEAFAATVKDVVLPGRAAFTRSDARSAATALLRGGAVRLKRPCGIGGVGQEVIHDAAGLEAGLAQIDDAELGGDGLVIERNLRDVRTLSVGQIMVAGFSVSYFGTQRVTRNNTGGEVYGGSELTVVRGTFDALAALALDDSLRTAIRQVERFDAAAIKLYPGMFASRRNYDVAQGVDDAGRWYSGVLEQSWRIGGATAAELGAVDLLASDPAVRAVRASTCELYGSDAVVPANASIHYQGTDPRVGPLIKFARAFPHDGA
jgi:hypothetical protein